MLARIGPFYQKNNNNKVFPRNHPSDVCFHGDLAGDFGRELSSFPCLFGRGSKAGALE